MTRSTPIVDLLVFGASGAIGQCLRERLDGRDDVVWVSRQPPRGPSWWRADLERGDPVPAAAAIISAGPLDVFARWLLQADSPVERVVAFSSTSATAKSASPDPAERDLAARLLQAEDTLRELCVRRNIGLTLLRPTLIYGRPGDRNLSRILELACARGWFLLPAGTLGRRQPVHAGDLAAAALAALAAAIGSPRTFELPGGETLPYDVMVERLLALPTPRPRLWRLPRPLFALAWRAARALGRAPASDAVLGRLTQDLVFDPAPAQAALGYRPREFRPLLSMFGAAPAGASGPGDSDAGVSDPDPGR